MDSKPFLLTLREYAEHTTINGVLYIFHPMFSRISQFFWFLVGLALIAVSILLIQQSYNNWQENPILTTVSTTGYPISKIEYPSITICGLGMVDSVLEGAILEQVIGYIEKHHNIINLTLQAGELYLDMLDTAGLTHEDFVKEEYPGIPVNTSLTELFMAAAKRYLLNAIIQKYQNELQDGLNSMELLNSTGLTYKEFFDATYPELLYDEQPQGIILQEMTQYLNNLAGYNIMNLTKLGDDEENDSQYFDIIKMKLKKHGSNYVKFLSTYYPGLLRTASYEELISSKVIGYIISQKYPSGEDFQNPADMFAAYQVDYSSYITARYPGSSPQFNDTDIMQQQIMNFIKFKTELKTTLLSNQTYKDLFPMNNLSYAKFLNEMYPGLDENVNLHDLISLLASPQADAFLLATAAVSKQKEMVNHTVITPCEGTFTYEYDTDNNICYRYAGLGSMEEVKNGELCDDQDEEVFSYDSEEQWIAFQILVNKSAKYCAIDPEDRIGCIEKGVNGADYETCINTLNCCWDPVTISCFFSKSLHILQESTENATFLGFHEVESEYYIVGHALWTTFNNWQNFSSFNITPSDEESYFKASPFLYLANNATINQTAGCFVILWPIFQSYRILFYHGAYFQLYNADCSEFMVHVVCRKPGVSPGTIEVVENQLTILDNMIKPDLTSQLTSRLNDMKNNYLKIFSNLDKQKSYQHLFEMLWYSQLPCFDINLTNSQSNSLLKRCEWKGVVLPCAAIFKTFPTDRGMCCTFNMAAAEDIFYNTTYQTTIADLQEKDGNSANESITSDYPDFSNKENRLIPRAGTKKGLSLILDAHSDVLASGSVGENFQGFLAVIGSPNEYPLLNQDNIYIRPGHYNLVGITAKDVQASEDIKLVSTEKRNCYFDDEYTLTLHKNYSQSNCFFECQMEYASNMTSLGGSNLHCTFWFLPRIESSEMCNPWIAQQYVEFMNNVPEDACDHCLPDCTFTAYEGVVTTVPFRKCTENSIGVSLLCDLNSEAVDPPIYAQQLINEFANNSVPSYAKRTTNIRMYNNEKSKAIFSQTVGETYDAYVEDIAEVNFYFQSSKVRLLRRDVTMSWIDFAGQIGGFLGLCDGFSFCSAIEIVFWFTCRLWYNSTRSKRTKEEEKESEL